MTALAWDLHEPADVALFLEPEGLRGESARVPWPCRAARLPLPPGDRAWIGAILPPGVALLPERGSPQRAVVAGPAAALRSLGERWPALGRLLARYTAPSPTLRFARGAPLRPAGRPWVVGILNVTPDSFSDGGRFERPEAALAHAERLAAEGADIIDIGGESTRPGAAPVDAETEMARVLPAIETIRRALPGLRISVDTRRAAVARHALEAGADLVNDVSGGRDPAMFPVVAAAAAPILLMHMRGEPATMQCDTRYGDLLGEVAAALEAAAGAAREAGVADDRILVDPGLGFGKSADGNEALLSQLGALRSLGLPIAVGASRKAFLGRRTGVSEPSARIAASVAAAVVATLEGAAMVRVHDVAATLEALAVAVAVRRPKGMDEGC